MTNRGTFNYDSSSFFNVQEQLNTQNLLNLYFNNLNAPNLPSFRASELSIIY